MKHVSLFLFSLLLIGLLGITLGEYKVQAVTAADWKPGRIIDDAIFQNKNSMSVAQIQQFLDSKVPNCDRNGTTMMWDSAYGDTVSRATFSARRGVSIPFTCLKEYVENPTTKENNVGRPTAVIPGGLSAAQLIYNAAQAQNINPQVYLVLLQKEQSLITDDWPWPKQFERATGNNCPDTAPCNPQYAWLWTQVNNSGAQFNNYVNNFDNYNYAPGWNNILYSPNTSCGTQSIFIENAFTAALYIYTPYAPNAAALNNMYGTGDSCSSYGNRNFWRLFSDWFGSTKLPGPYQGVSAINPPLVMVPGQSFTAQIVVKNTSDFTWYSDGNVPIGQRPIRLMSVGYRGIPYAANDPAWLGTNNQVRMVEASVAPGQNATFNIPLTAPFKTLNEKLKFTLVQDGIAAFPDRGMEFNISSPTPLSSYSGVSAINPPVIIYPGQIVTSQIIIKNTSQITWYSDGNAPTGYPVFRLMSLGYKPTLFAANDPAWLGTNNQVRMVEASVAPGQNATFNIPLIGPHKEIVEKLRLVPVLDGVASLQDLGMEFTLVSPKPIYSYAGVSAINPPLQMAQSQSSNVQLKIRNTGNTVWRNETVKPYGGYGTTRLAMIRPLYRNSPFYETTSGAWLSTNQIKMVEPVVNPGEIGTFDFTMKAPTVQSQFFEAFVPVIDGIIALPDIGMGFAIQVY